MKNKHFFINHPILFAVAMPIIAVLLSGIVPEVVKSFLGESDFISDLSNTISRVLFTVILLLIMKVTTDRKYNYFAHNENILKGFSLLWLLIVPVLFNLGEAIFQKLPLKSGASMVIVNIAFGFSVGFFEETVFRGLVTTNSMRFFKGNPKQTTWAIILSSVPFGLIHLANVLTGVNVVATIVQCFYATAFGAIFAAIYIRTRNLLSCALVHGIIDITSLVFVQNHEEAPATWEIVFLLLLSIACTVYAFYLLRPSKRQEISENFDVPAISSPKAVVSENIPETDNHAE